MDGIIEQKSKKKGKPSQFIYTPDAQNVKPAVVVVGYVMRAMIVCLGTAALSIFFCSAFLLDGLGGWGIFFVSLLFSAVLAFMAVKKKFFFIGGGVLLAGLTVPLFLTGDPIRYLTGSVGAFVDGIMDTLSSKGYQAPLHFGLPAVGGRTPSQMQIGGIVVFTLLIAVVMTFSILRKVHLLPLLLVGVPVCAAVFTYNFSNSNWGFALLIVVLCAVLVLRHYDVCFKDKRTTFRSAALGGYSGFTAAMLALLVVTVPACTVHQRWKPIGGISEQMEIARAVMSSILIGDKPDWSGVDSHGKVASLGTRSTEATPRYYTGAKMVEVFSDYKLPIYVKGFVAADYNDKDDRWRCANAKELDEFEEMFGEKFEPESYSLHFYDFAAPAASALGRTKRYDENLSLGFVTTRTAIDVLTTGSNMIFVPSRHDPRTGFLDFPGSRTEKALEGAYAGKVMNYFDGIRTTNWTNFDQSYAMHSFLPVYRDAKYPQTMQGKIRAYEANLAHIRQYYEMNLMKNGEYSLEAYMNDFGEKLNDGVIDYSMFRSFAGMSLSAQKAFYEQTVEPDRKYGEYVRKQYTAKMNSTVMTREALKIVLGYILPGEVEETETPEEGFGVIGKENEASVSLVTKYYKYEGSYYTAGGLLDVVGQKSRYDFTFFHRTVLGVVDYLKEQCAYTLTPAAAARLNSLNPTEKFLTETKEGYCVQFATAATFLLREMDIPVRYVEGFLADDLAFDRDSDNRLALYHTTVTDRNQHAWIEVWFDSVGWLTYETVPANYDSMYKIFSGPVVNPTRPDIGDDPIDDPKDDPKKEPDETGAETDPVTEDDGPDPKEVLKVLGIMAGIAAVIALAVFLIRKEKNRRLDLIEHREQVLYSIRSRELTDGERFVYGQQLSDLVIAAMKAGGMVRGSREFPSEFGARVDEALSELDDAPALPCSVSEIVPILETLAFGKKVPAEDLLRLADFYEALCAETSARFNPFERYWYCKVKCVV